MTINTQSLAKHITKLNSVVSVFVWLPAWFRIIQRGSAADYSLLSLLIIAWLQMSNLFIAVVDRSKNLKLYLIVNNCTVAFTCLLVWLYQR